MTLKRQYCEATPFSNFLDGVEANVHLWRSLARRAEVTDDVVERVRALGQRWHLLVLAEDWCGDAVNTLPVLAKLADIAENLDLRVLSRDKNPDLMDSHRGAEWGACCPGRDCTGCGLCRARLLGLSSVSIETLGGVGRHVDAKGGAIP